MILNDSLQDEIQEKNALLVVGKNVYTDKNGKERLSLHCLRSQREKKDGFLCEKISCLSSVSKNNLEIGDLIVVYYGAPRMYNGSAWSPVEGIVKINGNDGNN